FSADHAAGVQSDAARATPRRAVTTAVIARAVRMPPHRRVAGGEARARDGPLDPCRRRWPIGVAMTFLHVSASWLFLAAALVGAWFTYNTYRPLVRPAQAAAVSFFAGWLTSELAIHHIAWQLGMTALFAWAGALAAWPGRLGLAISVVSWVGLARCYAR